MSSFNIDLNHHVDAEIWVYEIHEPFSKNEYREPVGYSSFRNRDYDDMKDFREAVGKVADDLHETYENYHDSVMCVEVKFNMNYING